MTQKLKKYLVMAFMIVGVILVLTVVHSYSKPTIEIKIKNMDFNPIYSRIKVDGQRVFPRGSGGRTFILKTSPLKKTVTVDLTGPDFEQVTEQVAISPFNKASIEIETTHQTESEIVKRVSGDNFDEKTLRSYGALWIVVKPTNTQNADDVIALVLNYDSETGSWQNVAPEIISANKTIEIPKQVIDYFYELSDD